MVARDLQRAGEQEHSFPWSGHFVQVSSDDDGGRVAVDRHARGGRDVGHLQARLADPECLGDGARLFDQAPMLAGWSAKTPRAGVEWQHFVERVLTQRKQAANRLWQARRRNDAVDDGGQRNLGFAQSFIARRDVAFEE